MLALDQGLKIWVKTNMYLGEKITLAKDWAFLHFLENRGMAFGMEFGGDWGKLGLSLFRVAAVFAILFYLRRLIKEKAPGGLIVCASMVLAGAFGNIIDSALYGLIFSESEPGVWFPAERVAFGEGYASFLMGDVVDMLYFPLAEWHWPDWMPFFGGDRFQFFRPVFNIADAAISTGLISIFVFQKRFFKEELALAGPVSEEEE